MKYLKSLDLWGIKDVAYVLPNASLKASFIVMASFAYAWMVHDLFQEVPVMLMNVKVVISMRDYCL